MPRLKLTPELVEAMHRKVLESLSVDDEATLQTSANEWVAVTMDGGLRITELSVRGLGLEPEEGVNLEQAIISCVNSAVEAVARRKGERVAESFRDLGGQP